MDWFLLELTAGSEEIICDGSGKLEMEFWSLFTNIHMWELGSFVVGMFMEDEFWPCGQYEFWRETVFQT